MLLDAFLNPSLNENYVSTTECFSTKRSRVILPCVLAGLSIGGPSDYSIRSVFVVGKKDSERDMGKYAYHILSSDWIS
jgi:hypothetical protein